MIYFRDNANRQWKRDFDGHLSRIDVDDQGYRVGFQNHGSQTSSVCAETPTDPSEPSRRTNDSGGSAPDPDPPNGGADNDETLRAGRGWEWFRRRPAAPRGCRTGTGVGFQSAAAPG